MTLALAACLHATFAVALRPEVRAAAAGGGDVAVLVTVDEPQRPPERARRLGHEWARRRQRFERRLDGVRGALARAGARDLRPLWLASAVSARVPASTLAELAALPFVRDVRLDARLTAPALAPAVGEGAGWNLSALGAPTVWQRGATGTGALVATLDTGVDVSHPALADRWLGGPGGWLDVHGEHARPYDASGHGTQVMGLLVGREPGGAAVGVAPGARFIAAKVFDDAGTSTLGAVHRAFAWLLDPDGDPATDDAPQVVNASWGFNEAVGACDLEFAPDLLALEAAGVLVVFSAGNAGPGGGTSISPGNGPGVVSVGAVGEALAPATFSSRGPSACDGGVYPLLAAPGQVVRTTDRGSFGPGAYAYVTGTSFAAPHVAGGLAVLRGAFPAVPPAALVSALVATAVDIGVGGVDTATGHGLVDLRAAFELLAAADCHDRDGDGFGAGRGCPALVDCVDRDARISPAALEVPADGVDQDCDGADLTIEATARLVEGALLVVARSRLGAAAGLTTSAGPLRFDRASGTWRGRLSPAGPTLTVTGVEGSVVVRVALDPRDLRRRTAPAAGRR